MEHKSKYIALFLASALLAIASLWPYQSSLGLDPGSLRALGLLGFTIVLWASEALDAAVTSLLVFFFLPLLDILPLKEALSSLGTETVWQLVLIYMVAEAIGRFHLDKRLAYRLLLLSGGNTILLSGAFILAALLFTFFMPIPVGKVALILPLVRESLEALGLEPGGNCSRLIYYAVGSMGLFGSVGVLTGCPANLYTAQVMSEGLRVTWTFGQWLLTFFPAVLAAVVVVWFFLLRLWPPEQPQTDSAAFRLFLKAKVTDLGPLSAQEKKLSCIIGAMIALWATSGILHPLSIIQVSLLSVVTLFLPGIDLLSFKQAAAGISWSIILVFAAGLSLTKGLTSTGAAAWLGSLVSGLFQGLSPTAGAVAVFVFLVLIRTAFTTPTAYVAAMLPVVFAAGPNLGLNPVWLGALTVIAAHTAFLYPMQSMTLMTAYAASPLNPKAVFQAGSVATVVTVVLTLAFAFYYWPLLGLSPFL